MTVHAALRVLDVVLLHVAVGTCGGRGGVPLAFTVDACVVDLVCVHQVHA